MDIIDAIVTGISGPYTVEPDREAAISAAILSGRTGDIILIAGKGHETTQIIGDVSNPFDDRVVAARILERM